MERIEGRVAAVEQRENGFIDSVQLDDGRTVAGDLFADCSGFRSLLLGEALGIGFESWAADLPCNRAWAVQCEGGGGAEPFTRATARPAGWQWRIPLQHRVGNGHVFSSRHMDERMAHDLLLANLEGEPIGAPRLLTFEAGCRQTFWAKNCVGIGLAAGFLEPLESTSIHLIQVGVMRLLGLLPDMRCLPPLAEAYDAEMRAKFESVRDFLILHYAATERSDTPFWQERANSTLPPTLQARLDLYRASGIILPREVDLFRPSSWLAVLEGQGVTTNARLQIADRTPLAAVSMRLEELGKALGSSAGNMPPALEYINKLVGIGSWLQ